MAKERISKKRLRKIEHVQMLLDRGDNRAEVIQKAINHMKMKPEDIQRALGNKLIYPSVKGKETV